MIFTRFSWKLETTLKNAARRTRPFCCSITFGGSDGKVWKWIGRFTSFTACQSGSQTGCHMGSMSHEHDSSMPRRPIRPTRYLLHCGVDVTVGQAREPDEARGIVLAEVHEPVVVDPEQHG